MRLSLLAAVLSAAAPTIGLRAGHASAGRPSAVSGAASQPRAHVSSKLSTNPLAYSFGLQDTVLPLPGLPPADSPPQHHTISSAQIATLKRNGVVHIPGVLSDEWIEYMRTVTKWQVDHPHMWASPGVASGLYDYIQRNVWSTNGAYARFMYHSPVASCLAQLGETTEVRIATDLLMVNPNKGFKWHQDNQNGPVTFDKALRFWVTLDDTPFDHGAPVYIKGSHENTCVPESAVFVDISTGELAQLATNLLEFRPKAGDLLVWHPRTIHKIDGPSTQDWGTRLRRVLGGTVILGDAPYMGEGKALFSDLGRHALQNGDPLKGPLFPRIYPSSVKEERLARERGECTRTWEGVLRLMSNMAASAQQMVITAIMIIH
mmetsp:Transcript_48304/g.112940  ORF Transcript_48304/g.112940 Transcript_48304/m.112940 type:complete len:375 (-) Transcript_48304:185-1309(-)